MTHDEIMAAFNRAKPIPGFSRYRVTSDGIVLSVARGQTIIRKPYLQGPYLRVGMISDRDGKQHAEYIHTAILTAWVGPRPTPQHQGRHLDGDCLHNVLENLAWGLPVDNAADRQRHGRYDTQPCGEAHHAARLTERDVRTILERLDAGEYQYVIAADYGVAQTTISKIKRGVRWGDVIRGFVPPVSGREAA